MRFYTLHVPAIEPGSVLPDSGRLHSQMAAVVPIKEGFCWPAFFFSLIWSLMAPPMACNIGSCCRQLGNQCSAFPNWHERGGYHCCELQHCLDAWFHGQRLSSLQVGKTWVYGTGPCVGSHGRGRRAAVFRSSDRGTNKPWHLLSRS